MNYIDILHAQLRVDEGYRLKPYVDSVGKTTIGIGRNLTDVGINKGECALMFSNDLETAEHAARLLLSNFDLLSDVRKAAVMNMAFNMGYTKLSTFVNTLRAIDTGKWAEAYNGIINSKYYNQVGERADRVAISLRDNIWKG